MEERQFPKGILPVLPVADIDATVDFYTGKLKFAEHFRQKSPEGVSVNAQLSYSESTLMVNLNPEMAPMAGGGVYLWIRLFDQYINAYYEQLVAEGVDIVDEIKDQFWGDRSFVIKDCNGFHLAFNQAIGQ